MYSIKNVIVVWILCIYLQNSEAKEKIQNKQL